MPRKSPSKKFRKAGDRQRHWDQNSGFPFSDIYITRPVVFWPFKNSNIPLPSPPQSHAELKARNALFQWWFWELWRQEEECVSLEGELSSPAPPLQLQLAGLSPSLSIDRTNLLQWRFHVAKLKYFLPVKLHMHVGQVGTRGKERNDHQWSQCEKRNLYFIWNSQVLDFYAPDPSSLPCLELQPKARKLLCSQEKAVCVCIFWAGGEEEGKSRRNSNLAYK